MTDSNDFDYESALERCAAGDRDAFRALYDRESRWLLGVAVRIVRDRDRGHDVLHDAFVRIWQKAGTYRRELGSARGWIYTVVRHQALDTIRADAREVAVGDDIESLADGILATSGAADTTADALALRTCLERLEPDRRRYIVSAFVEGYTYEQIARAANQPLGSVKSWIRRSLLALKECLS